MLPQLLNFLQRESKTHDDHSIQVNHKNNKPCPCTPKKQSTNINTSQKVLQRAYLRGQCPPSPSASRATSPTPCIQRLQFDSLHVNAFNSCNQTMAQPSPITHLQPSRKRFTHMPHPCIPLSDIPTPQCNIATRVLDKSISSKPECFESAVANSLHPASPISLSARQRCQQLQSNNSPTIPHHASLAPPQALHAHARSLHPPSTHPHSSTKHLNTRT
jgi:hypothetical protein